MKKQDTSDSETKGIASALAVRESRRSAERSEAELKVPDPQPEVAKAIFQKKEGETDDTNEVK